MQTTKEQQQKPTRTTEIKREPRSLPAPGRIASFEEAKDVLFKKYDNALRELAK